MSREGLLATVAIGFCFGFLLTASGLGDYDTIHDGLLLRDGYIYLMLVSAVAVAAGGVALLRRAGRTMLGGPLVLPQGPVRRSTLMGAGVFGVGFGVGATCPGITVAMIATGGLYGAVVLAGIFGGLWARGLVVERSHGRQREVAGRRSNHQSPTNGRTSGT